ncbi:MAG: hypothetical protein HPY50_12790 [Firmicutes bacterium]|nr:hypothetical protein [Bacillota bacterium]
MKRGRIKNVYPGGNTAVGFYSLFDSALAGMKRVIIIKGGPGTGKSTLIRNVGLAMVDRGYDVEFMNCASDNGSLDGVIVPAGRVAVVDGTAPHTIDPKYPGAVDEIVNLGDHWNESHLKKHRREIIEATNEIGRRFSEAYERFGEARGIEREWEEMISRSMDFGAVDQMTEKLMEEVFQITPRVRYLFAGALTPEGAVNFIENLTEDCERRFILKGSPGCGKSTLIKRVADAAVARGYSIDLFHCAFDPKSLDMVIIHGLRTAVIDGSTPHEFEPKRACDYVIDLMQYADMKVLEGYKNEMVEREARFAAVLESGLEKIQQAKELHDHLETFYIEAMDFSGVEDTGLKVLEKVLDAVHESEV